MQPGKLLSTGGELGGLSRIAVDDDTRDRNVSTASSVPSHFTSQTSTTSIGLLTPAATPRVMEPVPVEPPAQGGSSAAAAANRSLADALRKLDEEHEAAILRLCAEIEARRKALMQEVHALAAGGEAAGGAAPKKKGWTRPAPPTPRSAADELSKLHSKILSDKAAAEKERTDSGSMLGNGWAGSLVGGIAAGVRSLSGRLSTG